MYPPTHFLVSFFIGVVLVKCGYFSYFHAFMTGAIAALMDIDHFISYYVFKKDFNLRHAWNAAVKRIIYERTFIHHWIGIIIISLLLVIVFFISKIWFWIIVIAYYPHIILDHLKIRRWFGLRKRFKFKEEGFIVKVTIYEVILDLVLVILLLFLIFYI